MALDIFGRFLFAFAFACACACACNLWFSVTVITIVAQNPPLFNGLDHLNSVLYAVMQCMLFYVIHVGGFVGLTTIFHTVNISNEFQKAETPLK